MIAGVLRILVGRDARRPASWIGLAIGALAGRCVAVADPHPWAIGPVLVLPVLAVVAAIGDLPRDICRVAVRGSPVSLAAVWFAERAAWPLGGGIVTAMLWAAPERSIATAAVGAALAGLLALLVVARVRSSAATAADAATLALACGSCGGLVGLVARSAGVATWGAVAGATACSWAVAILAEAWLRRATAGERWSFTGEPPAGIGASAGWELLHLGPMPAVGPVQAGLEKLAMATALLAMAGWLTLRSDILIHADDRDAAGPPVWAWAGLSAAWFVSLGVPRATLLDGVCGSACWDRLLRSVAVHPRRGSLRGMQKLSESPPTTTRFAVIAAMGPAAMLAWPPLVSGLLSLSRPAHAWPSLAMTAGLAVAGLVLAALAVGGARLGADRESLLACALAVAAAAAIAPSAAVGVNPAGLSDSAQTSQSWRAVGRQPGLPGPDFMLRKMRLPAKLLP